MPRSGGRSLAETSAVERRSEAKRERESNALAESLRMLHKLKDELDVAKLAIKSLGNVYGDGLSEVKNQIDGVLAEISPTLRRLAATVETMSKKEPRSGDEILAGGILEITKRLEQALDKKPEGKPVDLGALISAIQAPKVVQRDAEGNITGWATKKTVH